jgi:hypothetical protein
MKLVKWKGVGNVFRYVEPRSITWETGRGSQLADFFRVGFGVELPPSIPPKDSGGGKSN